MMWLWDNAATLATVAMGIAAVAALIYAHLQIADSRKGEHRANANELWRETLRLAFDNPKLSDPTLALAKFNYDEMTIDGSKVARCSPVFKLTGVRGTRVSVTLDGKPLVEGKSVATHVDEKTGTALVRVIGRITTAVNLAVSIK